MQKISKKGFKAPSVVAPTKRLHMENVEKKDVEKILTTSDKEIDVFSPASSWTDVPKDKSKTANSKKQKVETLTQLNMQNRKRKIYLSQEQLISSQVDIPMNSSLEMSLLFDPTDKSATKMNSLNETKKDLNESSVNNLLDDIMEMTKSDDLSTFLSDSMASIAGKGSPEASCTTFISESESEIRRQSAHILQEEDDPGANVDEIPNSQLTPKMAISSQSMPETLSQPPPGRSHRQRLEWLQRRRACGLFVQCDAASCHKWRFLGYEKDPATMPSKWFCHMNKDKRLASCVSPEMRCSEALHNDLIEISYTAGSLVWAKMAGYPWWPAMVDDCPDVQQFYWLDNLYDSTPSFYNVTFFDADEVSRSWLPPSRLANFKGASPPCPFATKYHKQKKQVQAATNLALNALKLNIRERLKKCSFLALYKGPIISPPPSDDDDESVANSANSRSARVEKPLRVPCSAEEAERIRSSLRVLIAKREARPTPETAADSPAND